MAKQQGICCSECGDALANRDWKTCPFCYLIFHSGCVEWHTCPAMRRYWRGPASEKLAAWETAAQAWSNRG